MGIKALILITIFVSISALAATDSKTESKTDSKRNPLTQINLKSYIENISDDYALETMDSENKGTPDMYALFKKGANQNRILVTQLFDFNRDGKIDLANHFQKGKKSRAEYDLDFDGKVDTLSEFDEAGALFKKTLVESGNLLWKYWHNGELRRKEVDRNGDGDPDMWVHYRNGRIVKTEIDVNFDGKNIRLESDLNKKSN